MIDSFKTILTISYLTNSRHHKRIQESAFFNSFTLLLKSALLQPRSPSLNICFCLMCVCSENEWEKSPFLVFDDKCESWEQSRARWKILRACISGNCHNCQQHWGGICNSRKTSENKSHHISQKKEIYFGNIVRFLTDKEGGSVLGFV